MPEPKRKPKLEVVDPGPVVEADFPVKRKKRDFPEREAVDDEEGAKLAAKLGFNRDDIYAFLDYAAARTLFDSVVFGELRTALGVTIIPQKQRTIVDNLLRAWKTSRAKKREILLRHLREKANG